MLLVPSCFCGGELGSMEKKASQAFTRIQFRSLGYTDKDALAQAIAIDDRRIRLVCEKCEQKYIVAGDKKTFVACLCDEPMTFLAENKNVRSWQWLEQRWYCKECDYTATIGRLLERGSIFVWHEKGGALRRRAISARSIKERDVRRTR
jgi:ribosomal protein S27AE